MDTMKLMSDVFNAEMEEKIINLAKKHGWKGVTRGDRKGTFPLDAAIKYLEENFKMPSDPLEHVFGGTKQHHLRDFAHHHSYGPNGVDDGGKGDDGLPATYDEFTTWCNKILKRRQKKSKVKSIEKVA